MTQRTTRIEIDEDFLTCTVCWERYKNAKILPCLHSFCAQCVVGFVEKDAEYIKCPVCRQKCPVPDGGLEQLKPSFFLNNILAMAETKQKGEGTQVCDSCQERKPDNRCVECALDICSICSNAHKKIPATRNHKLLSFAEYEEAKTISPSLVQPAVHCSKHVGSELKFYCSTCKVGVCVECTIIDHRAPEHQHLDIAVVAKKYREELEIKIAELKLTEKEMHDSKINVEEASKLASERYLEEQRIIKQHTQEVIERVSSTLREEEGELLDGLKAKHCIVRGNIKKELGRLQTALEVSTKTRKFVENLLRFGNMSQMMSLRSETSNTMDSLVALDSNSPESIMAIPHFIPRDVTVEGHLGAIGIPMLPSQLHLDVSKLPAVVRIGQEVSVTIETKKYDPDKDIGCTSMMVAELEEPSGEINKLDISVCKSRDKHSRTFTVKMVPKDEGNHRLTVKIKNLHIKGSPNAIDVMPSWKAVHEMGDLPLDMSWWSSMKQGLFGGSSTNDNPPK
ncbi:E3 ubiquitin-protein ligase TRIM56-like [Saccoglossus kowalevskii]|uniref:E3 ubiquitin-protein ligase TRIM56-like n=1 Tax=Saccoglossus kowalevskii TaxID=10224 RepID=A0ABM0N0I1_SACKO|nr:PREDICTED: E3 ubiquitin-protein ligase TRIM56-like [Saccoglossus kowalevskii]